MGSNHAALLTAYSSITRYSMSTGLRTFWIAVTTLDDWLQFKFKQWNDKIDKIKTDRKIKTAKNKKTERERQQNCKRQKEKDTKISQRERHSTCTLFQKFLRNLTLIRPDKKTYKTIHKHNKQRQKRTKRQKEKDRKEQKDRK